MVVLLNLYGDIESDLGAGMTMGSLAPGAARSVRRRSMFEATHGSAPKSKGRPR